MTKPNVFPDIDAMNAAYAAVSLRLPLFNGDTKLKSQPSARCSQCQSNEELQQIFRREFGKKARYWAQRLLMSALSISCTLASLWALGLISFHVG